MQQLLLLQKNNLKYLTYGYSRFLAWCLAQSYENVNFFKYLDVVSIATYFRLVFNPKAKVPDYETTVKLFKWRAYRIQRWLTSKGLLSKGMLFAEVGFQSKGNLILHTVFDRPAKSQSVLFFSFQQFCYQWACSNSSNSYIARPALILMSTLSRPSQLLQPVGLGYKCPSQLFCTGTFHYYHPLYLNCCVRISTTFPAFLTLNGAKLCKWTG